MIMFIEYFKDLSFEKHKFMKDILPQNNLIGFALLNFMGFTMTNI